MTLRSLPALVASALLLAACATQNQPASPGVSQAPEVTYPHRNGQLDLPVSSGNYQCEMGVSIKVEREYKEQVNTRVLLGWKGGKYQLERDNSSSGLPRFRDRKSGLVWVDLPWKSVLLDGKTSKPLASECKAA